jgi:hypothetical protein
MSRKAGINSEVMFSGSWPPIAVAVAVERHVGHARVRP